MITASPGTRQPARLTPAWQTEMAQAISDPQELCSLLGLDPALVLPARAAAQSFALRVPRGFVARMRRGDPSDPLLRQVLPMGAELHSPAHHSGDPLHEAAALRAPGLLHKYRGRALLIATGACAVHCRYCFRREFPYSEQNDAAGRWAGALEVLRQDASISELLLSGGDPLSLNDARLTQLTAQLRDIPHLRRLRIHTRQPIVLPSRVDDGLLAWLGALPWRVVMVLHCNHANEIDAEVRAACARLRDAGVTLLNQTVLLAGINDEPATLEALSEALWQAGVLPYYLHLLDPVNGTAHFDVPELRARQLLGALSGALPGYLVPRLVREVPGATAKVSIAPLL
ncbi:MAG: EF-P beta-lysylation protein EpmB [Steroidobacteraceae bacterium]